MKKRAFKWPQGLSRFSAPLLPKPYMDRNMHTLIDIQAVAAEVFATLNTGHQIKPFSSRICSFNLDDAYRVTAAVRKMRETRGELAVGRKIGFTNRTIWPNTM
jgi:2-keto-4-pentenoate hydratase